MAYKRQPHFFSSIPRATTAHKLSPVLHQQRILVSAKLPAGQNPMLQDLIHPTLAILVMHYCCIPTFQEMLSM